MLVSMSVFGRSSVLSDFFDCGFRCSGIVQIINPVFSLSSIDVAKKQHTCSFFGLRELFV